jgi:hypothetical protein
MKRSPSFNAAYVFSGEWVRVRVRVAVKRPPSFNADPTCSGLAPSMVAK